MGGGGGKTIPIPYVSDGLVAAWDGEYNTGVSHDDNAPNWIDCVNGFVLNGVNPQWGDKYSLFEVSSYFSGTDSSVFSQNYVEIVVKLAASLGRIYRIRAYDTSPNILCFHSSNGIAIATTANNSFAVATKDTLLSYHVDYSTHNLWCNGVALSPSGTYSEPNSGLYTIGASYWRGNYRDFFAGKIYCVRIYNRQLTAEEIAYNYNVDKERFGL